MWIWTFGASWCVTSRKNVTRASEQLGITQPAMSNILRRLRKLFNDPLLIRSSEGMTPTERALELQPRVRELLADLTQLLEPRTEFRPLYLVVFPDYDVDCRSDAGA